MSMGRCMRNPIARACSWEVLVAGSVVQLTLFGAAFMSLILISFQLSLVVSPIAAADCSCHQLTRHSRWPFASAGSSKPGAYLSSPGNLNLMHLFTQVPPEFLSDGKWKHGLKKETTLGRLKPSDNRKEIKKLGHNRCSKMLKPKTTSSVITPNKRVVSV